VAASAWPRPMDVPMLATGCYTCTCRAEGGTARGGTIAARQRVRYHGHVLVLYAETRESGQSVEVLAAGESSAVSAWDVCSTCFTPDRRNANERLTGLRAALGWRLLTRLWGKGYGLTVCSAPCESVPFWKARGMSSSTSQLAVCRISNLSACAVRCGAVCAALCA
jgi:hypothetical protein